MLQHFETMNCILSTILDIEAHFDDHTSALLLRHFVCFSFWTFTLLLLVKGTEYLLS